MQRSHFQTSVERKAELAGWRLESHHNRLLYPPCRWRLWPRSGEAYPCESLAEASSALDEAIDAAWCLELACGALYEMCQDPLHEHRTAALDWISSEASDDREGWLLAEQEQKRRSSLLCPWTLEDINGLVVDDGDPDALRQAMTKYLARRSAEQLASIVGPFSQEPNSRKRL